MTKKEIMEYGYRELATVTKEVKPFIIPKYRKLVSRIFTAINEDREEVYVIVFKEGTLNLYNEEIGFTTMYCSDGVENLNDWIYEVVCEDY